MVVLAMHMKLLTLNNLCSRTEEVHLAEGGHNFLIFVTLIFTYCLVHDRSSVNLPSFLPTVVAISSANHRHMKDLDSLIALWLQASFHLGIWGWCLDQCLMSWAARACRFSPGGVTLSVTSRSVLDALWQLAASWPSIWMYMRWKRAGGGRGNIPKRPMSSRDRCCWTDLPHACFQKILRCILDASLEGSQLGGMLLSHLLPSCLL